jgi:thiol-disulfide isomerase/thioredoxin
MKRLYACQFASIFIIGIFLAWITPVGAQTPVPENPVYIYLFWGEGCPHCAKAKPYFENLAATYPEIQLRTYEVYYVAENQELFSLMAEKYGLEQLAVPTVFLGPYILQGYSEEYNAEIEKVIIQCIHDGCADLGLGVINTPPITIPTATVTLPVLPSPIPLIEKTPVPTTVGITQTTIPDKEITPVPTMIAGFPTESPGSIDQTHNFEIPLLGSVNLETKSSFVSTILIALVDGFNPCSLWVLTMLLALTLHTGSRKKVFIIGIVFLTVTAGIYALFITGLFSILKITSAMSWIRILVALIALFFALVNIKDYFWYKEGISFTIADDKKSGIFKKMRAVMDASQSFTGLIGATIALAVGVSIVEFSCTAGFPVIWTNILTAQKISGISFVLLLVIYMVIYQLDEMIIFFSSVATLKASRIEEKHGRVLKLISGMLMLTLSIIMLINPALLNNLTRSLMVFGFTFLATLVILLVHRYLFPKLGIRIGSDYLDKKT